MATADWGYVMKGEKKRDYAWKRRGQWYKVSEPHQEISWTLCFRPAHFSHSINNSESPQAAQTEAGHEDTSPARL